MNRVPVRARAESLGRDTVRVSDRPSGVFNKRISYNDGWLKATSATTAKPIRVGGPFDSCFELLVRGRSHINGALRSQVALESSCLGSRAAPALASDNTRGP